MTRALLHSAVRFRLDEQVRDRILAATRATRWRLLELPRGLSTTELAGFGTGSISASPDAVEESFRRRLAALPEETRRLLLIASAEPLGEGRRRPATARAVFRLLEQTALVYSHVGIVEPTQTGTELFQLVTSQPAHAA